MYENVAFAMQVVEAPRREMQKRVNTVLDLVGLKIRLKVFQLNYPVVSNNVLLSLGRLLITRWWLLRMNRRANLDPETSWDIMKIFDRINKDGTTIVMATHDKSIVDTMKKGLLRLKMAV